LFLLVAVLLVGCNGSPAPQTQTPQQQAAAAQQTAAPAADQNGTQQATSQTAAPDAQQPSSASSGASPGDAAAQAAQTAESDASAPSAVDSSKFKEGVQYYRLSPVQPTSTGPDKVEVAEFFMYSCPHCYHFDPYVEQWLKSIPDYIHFIRVPTVWNKMVKLHAQAYYTAQALGKLKEMHAAFFREMHVNNDYMQTEDSLADFFAKFGVSKKQFKETFDSFAVHEKVQRADELARRYGIDATPTMVVNGKYVTNASMTGGYDSLLELVSQLAASEHAGETP
jgi:thiol:disulfide interchange protein DsbA